MTTTEYDGPSTPEQRQRQAALTAARAAIGRSSGVFTSKTVTEEETDALLAVAQWVLDGSRLVTGELLEVQEVRTDESDEPVRAVAFRTLPVPDTYTDGSMLIVVGRSDLSALLDGYGTIAADKTDHANAAWRRLAQAEAQS